MEKQAINLEMDNDTGECYIVWRPLFIGAGLTAGNALEDLRQAAHFGVDMLINFEKTKLIKEE